MSDYEEELQNEVNILLAEAIARDKRIAELEAELADGYACHVAAHVLLEERAEKADADANRIARELQPLQEENAFLKAEVERLTAERDFWRKGIEMHPWTKPGDLERHQAAFEAIYASTRRKEVSP